MPSNKLVFFFSKVSTSIEPGAVHAYADRRIENAAEPDMIIALHKNATTRPATWAAIQSAVGSDYELARRAIYTFFSASTYRIG